MDNSYDIETNRICRLIAQDHLITYIQSMQKKAHEQLLEFIELNDEASVCTLLKENPELDLNFSGLDNWTALHLSSTRGYESLSILLLDNGCNINAKTTMNRTPLHLACINNHINIVLILIEYQCDINLQDNDKNTALHYAASQGFEGIVEVLINNGADWKIFNNLCRNPADLCLNLNTFNCFVQFYKGKIDLTGYSRTAVEHVFLHNSREDHVNQMMWKAKIQHKQDDFELFYNRPKLVSRRILNLPESKVKAEDFSVIMQLGRGSFGNVFLVEKCDSKERFALKVLDKEKIFKLHMEKYAFTERNILMKLESPFVVKLHYAFQTCEKLVLVMDFCSKGDFGMLLHREKTLTEAKARFYTSEIILGLETLHKNNIIFRDLKPDNILIDESNHIKLTDFGLSKENIDSKSQARSFCGSPLYLAPEMLTRSGHSQSIDWYVVGLLLYEMLHGRSPFYHPKKAELYKKIRKGKIVFKDDISDEAKDLIIKLARKDPKKRLGSGPNDADEIKAHPFFDGVDWNEVASRTVIPPDVRSIPRVERLIPMNLVYGRLDDEDDKDNVNNWSFLQ